MSGMFDSGNVPAQRHKSVEWYTPASVFTGLACTFDLDPASPHDATTAVPATRKLTIFDDGLSQPWQGRVWLNPPYGPTTGLWMRRMIEHGNGIALVFSRTDTSWCQEVMRSADALLFWAGRIEFDPGLENRHKKSRCGAGTLLAAWGEQNVDALQRLAERGVFVRRPASRRLPQPEPASVSLQTTAKLFDSSVAA